MNACKICAMLRTLITLVLAAGGGPFGSQCAVLMLDPIAPLQLMLQGRQCCIKDLQISHGLAERPSRPPHRSLVGGTKSNQLAAGTQCSKTSTIQ